MVALVPAPLAAQPSCAPLDCARPAAEPLRDLSLRDCIGGSAARLALLWPLAPLRQLAITDGGAQLCAVLHQASLLSGLTALELAHSAPSAQQFAGDPAWAHALDSLPSLTGLHALRLRLHGHFYRSSPGTLARLSALSLLTALSLVQVLDARDVVLRTAEAAVTNADLAALAGMPGLRELRLSGAGICHDGHNAPGLRDLARAPRLKSLALDCCHAVTDADCFALADCLPPLRALDLSFCQRVTAVGVRRLAAALPDLQVLRLDGCHVHMTDAGLGVLVHLRSLQRLSIAFCDSVTTAGVLALLLCLPELQHIDCRGCDRVDVRALAAEVARLGRGELHVCQDTEGSC